MVQHAKYEKKYDIMMKKHEKECDDKVEHHEKECHAMAEKCKRKLEIEKSIHEREYAEMRKMHKNNQAKEKQRPDSMARDYRSQLKVSSYLDSNESLSLHNSFAAPFCYKGLS